MNWLAAKIHKAEITSHTVHKYTVRVCVSNCVLSYSTSCSLSAYDDHTILLLFGQRLAAMANVQWRKKVKLQREYVYAVSQVVGNVSLRFTCTMLPFGVKTVLYDKFCHHTFSFIGRVSCGFWIIGRMHWGSKGALLLGTAASTATTFSVKCNGDGHIQNDSKLPHFFTQTLRQNPEQKFIWTISSIHYSTILALHAL